jgi:hypothetical protein
MDLPIVIPCFFHTPETSERLTTSEKLDIDVHIDDEEYDVRDIHFFNISFILKHPELDQSMIGSNGDEFRSPLTVKEILKRINNGN